MTQRRRSELLNKINDANSLARGDHANGLMDGFNLLSEVVADLVRELGPSAHADAVQDLHQASPQGDGAGE